MQYEPFLALLVCVPLGGLSSALQHTPIPPEPKPLAWVNTIANLTAIPKDLAITPNGKVAFVACDNPNPAQCNTDLILAIDLTTGARLNFPDCTPCNGWLGSLRYAADAVEVTDTHAIVIGSGPPPAENTLYVNIFAIDTTVPSVTPIQCYSYVEGGGGYANDLAITPDGSKAVVTHGAAVKVYDISTANLAPLLGKFCPGIPAPVWATEYKQIVGQQCSIVQVRDIAADSVAVTDTRALVQYNWGDICLGVGCNPPQQIQFHIPHPQVYAISLDTISGGDLICDPSAVGRCGFLVLECGAVPPANCACYPVSDCAADMIHDVAISPNGSRAIGASYSSMSLVDIGQTSPTFAWSTGGVGAGGMYRDTSSALGLLSLGSVVDSIAMSNTRAIALQDDNTVRVFDISSGTMTPVATTPALPGGIKVHDVAISPDGLRGIANCLGVTYLFTDLSAVPTPVVAQSFPIESPRGTEYPGNLLRQFVSDSVLITNQYAVALSFDPTVQPDPITGLPSTTGMLRFFSTTTGAIYRTINIPLGLDDDRLVDLTLSTNDHYLFVRGSDSTRDLLGFVLQTGLPVGRSFDLAGECTAVDSIEATNSRVITISSIPGSGTGGVVDIYRF